MGFNSNRNTSSSWNEDDWDSWMDEDYTNATEYDEEKREERRSYSEDDTEWDIEYARMKQNVKLIISDEGDIKLEIPSKVLV